MTMLHFQWYIWLALGVGFLVLIVLLTTCICHCCCRDNIDNKNKSDGDKKKKKKKRITYDDYNELANEEEEAEYGDHHSDKDKDGGISRGRSSTSRGSSVNSNKRHYNHRAERNVLRGQKQPQDEPLTYYVPATNTPHHRAIDRAAQYNESGAESSLSDVADHVSGSVSISAYGDMVSRTGSTGSRRTSGTSSSFTRKPGDLAIQASLIYSRDSKYVAGKVVMIDGIRAQLAAASASSGIDSKSLVEIKCHVVILPMKKYALKTNWYPIKKERVKMDEYFKFKFKEPPPERKTTLRLRLYGRKGTLGRSHCLGECYVNLREIVTSRGGLTLWRQVNKGVPEIVDLE